MNRDTKALEGLVDLHCKELKLSGLRSGYRELAREALDKGITPIQFLLSCLELEYTVRQQNRLGNHMKAAKFPVVKTLDAFDFMVIPNVPKAKILQVADGDFIRQRENVIFLGPSGTGKTHCGIALGVAALEAGYRVRFIRAVTLAQELLLAQQEVRLNRYMKSWHKVDLVNLDELGYLGLGPGGPLLFQFVTERYETTGSILLTTNLEFSRWEEVFGDVALTTALLDRLTHRSHIVAFQGESYRFRESRQRQKENLVTSTIKAIEPE
jgi:DNA replication protein DnaC